MTSAPVALTLRDFPSLFIQMNLENEEHDAHQIFLHNNRIGCVKMLVVQYSLYTFIT